MTAICPAGGPSAAKAGFNTNVVVTAAAIEGILAIVGLEAVAAILAPIIAPTVLELTTFCTTDPPADPGIDGTDIIAATNWLDPVNAINAQEKIRQWFMANYWYTVCECTGGGTPAAPGYSSPGNDITTNPGLPKGPTTTPCVDKTESHLILSSFLISWDGILGGFDEVTTGGTQHRTDGLPQPLPPSIQLTITNAGDAVSPQTNGTPDITYQFFDSSITSIGGVHHLVGPAPHATVNYTLTPPAGAIVWSLRGTGGVGSNDHYTVTIRAQVFCSGAPVGGISTPCCPPDPALELKIDQIMQLLTSIFQSLPTPISSYSEGAVHGGLSGNGSVALDSSTVAVRVEVTTLPSYLGELIGTPTTLFDAGFLTQATAEGPVSTVRLEYTTQVVQLAQLVDELDYTLAGGLVVTVTELSPGP